VVTGPASFSDVDAAEVAPLVAMMDATDRWQAVGAAREWVLSLAGADLPGPVLDVGCGPGTFAAMARRAGHSTVDADRSRAMVAAARARDRSAPGVVADVVRLPFAAGAAGLVHCERVLQWTPDPDAALVELWRATAPGGWLAVTDTDWGTFSVDAPEQAMADALSAAALGWVPHPRLAPTLGERLGALGPSSLERRTDVVRLTEWDPDDPAQADGPPGLPLHSIAAGAPTAQRERAAAAVAALAERARQGRFGAELTLVTVVARR
jgi:SAM-dependent methyltransferase